MGGAGSQTNPAAVQDWNHKHRDALASSNAFVAQAQDQDVKPRVLEHLDPRYHQAIASGDEQEAQRIKESWELIEPWIPVLGAGIEAYEGFEEGRYAKGVLNTGLAATEVLGIGYLKKLASLGAKKALNQSIKQLFKKEAVKQVEKVGANWSFKRSALQFGQQMHKEYKVGEVLKNVRIKEYIIPNSGGKRIDFIDFSTKTIYELKPNNPQAILRGKRQLFHYKTLIERQFGPGWKTVLDTY